MTQNNFKPAWWLNSGHLQTIFPVVFSRNIHLIKSRERLELPDNDYLDLDWIGENNDDIVLILHGLGGSSSSHYARGMMSALLDHNYKVVLMHFRGCSGEPNRLARSYHSGDTQDLSFVVKTIKNRYPNAQLSIVGYSLGGNVLLKFLGQGIKNDLIRSAVAVSVPFDLGNVVNRIKTGFSKIYQWHLLKQLKSDMLKKEHLIASLVDCSSLKKVKNFQEFDELITAPLHGFTGANEYYLISSCRQYLKEIAVPTLIIHAADDPFMTAACIPRTEELSKKITFELYQAGGHVGFIAASNQHKPIFWLETRIPDFLNSGKQC